jgi:hypothetical protein
VHARSRRTSDAPPTRRGRAARATDAPLARARR